MRIKVTKKNPTIHVPCRLFVCQKCGHVIGVGESIAICRECGSTNIASEEDPDKEVILKCSS